MDPIALIAAGLSLVGTCVAIVLAFRAAEKATRAEHKADHPLIQSPPTREERMAWARGHIEAAKGAELALQDHANELPAALLLAQYRAGAARARADLRAMGVEP